MMSQTGKQIITIHTMPDISRSKGISFEKERNTMKFGKLIKYNMRDIYLI